MEELWEASSGVRSEEADAELLILLRMSFFCTPRPNNTHTHTRRHTEMWGWGTGVGAFITENMGIQESIHIKGACMSNRLLTHKEAYKNGGMPS